MPNKNSQTRALPSKVEIMVYNYAITMTDTSKD